MELINTTPMQAGYTIGIAASAREFVVVVVKGTFHFPDREGEPAVLANEQAPLVMADTFTGEPGSSAPLYESDFALVKPRCDVIVTGSAHAPGGRPTARFGVGIRVGDWSKTFMVVGDRRWHRRGLSWAASDPVPITEASITYDRAFGGVDDRDPDPSKHDACMMNPVGVGFHSRRSSESLEGMPLPSLEETRDPITGPWKSYRPMSLGPIGRGWTPRLNLAGSYDQHWLDHVFPFLPADFDDRYHQSAPEDQQIAYPTVGQEVVLLNLTPRGRESFVLPTVDIPVVFFRRGGERVDRRAVLDTVVIEPSLTRLQLVWRVNIPLRRSIFEMSQAVVGRVSRGWWRAFEVGKIFYPSLNALALDASARRRQRVGIA